MLPFSLSYELRLSLLQVHSAWSPTGFQVKEREAEGE